MMRKTAWLGMLMCAFVWGCPTDPDPTPPPTSTGGNGGTGGSSMNEADTDKDGISDAEEGADDKRDTDGDGTPDFEDTDSDDDGIPDAEEAGDADPSTPPIDTDQDGKPDYIDTDSDDNGITDKVEGTNDDDGDLKGNWIDFDNDGDGIDDKIEIGADAENPADTDMDKTPDYLDTDSDDDTILDKDERAIDPDMDGKMSYVDDDSDGDCVLDANEAGDSDPKTAPVDTDGDDKPDFHDRDSDDDGLADGAEDANCNGMQDGDESSPQDADSDDDGVSDLIEKAAGTNPNDPMDNPQAKGDFVFVVPFEEDPTPKDDDLDFSTSLQQVDVFVLLDRSGSMTSEINSIKANIQSVANSVACPAPPAMPTPGCIPDIWWGAGTVGYAGSNGQPFTTHLELQSDPAAVGPAIPANEPSGCCVEPLLLGLWSTVTGDSPGDAMCSVSQSYPAKTDCSGSPAGPNGTGYPCFREKALPIVLLVTDEPPWGGSSPNHPNECPAHTSVISEYNKASAKIVGITGSNPQDASTFNTNMAALATGTGAVDSTQNNAPLVIPGGNAQAATAIESAIKQLALGVPLDVSAQAKDDDSDMVDAVAAFIDRLETQQLGTAECSDMLTDKDTNNDSFPDEFVAITAGTPVCWKVVAKKNTTVQPTSEPQLFQSTIEVYGDQVTQLDKRDVYFLVPPKIEEINIPK